MLLLASLSVGAYILSFFGISIPVLRVAGGIVVGSAGWKLLHSASDEKKGHAEAATEGAESLGVQAFYPLTLPITVGPGSIAVAIALATSFPREGSTVVRLAAVGTALLLLSAFPAWAVDVANRQEKEALLQTAKRRMIEVQ